MKTLDACNMRRGDNGSAFRVSLKSDFVITPITSLLLLAGTDVFHRLMSRLDDSARIHKNFPPNYLVDFLCRCGIDSDSIDSGRVEIYDFV